MALPDTIGTGISNSLRLPGCDAHPTPLLNGTDVYVAALVPGAGGYRPSVYKNTNPGTASFSAQDESNRPTNPAATSSNNLRFAYCQNGSDIHMVTAVTDGDTNGHLVEYHVFSMSSDTWTTTNQTVVDNSASKDGLGSIAETVSIVYDGVAGEVVIVCQDEVDKVMGTAYGRWGLYRKPASTWLGPIVPYNTGDANSKGYPDVHNSSDGARQHIWSSDGASSNLGYATHNAGSFSTYDTTTNDETGGGTNDIYSWQSKQVVNNGTNDFAISVGIDTQGGTPTRDIIAHRIQEDGSNDLTTGGTTRYTEATTLYLPHHVTADGDDLYLIAKSDSANDDLDIWKSTDQGQNWTLEQADFVVDADGFFTSGVACSVYTRSGTKYLAIVGVTNPNYYYHEYSLAAGPEALTLSLGSYTVSGQTQTLRAVREAVLTAGSYTLNGQTLDLFHVLNLTLGLGSYAVTGYTQELRAVRELVLDAGSYTQTGYDIDLTKVYPLALTTGSYTLNGQTVDIFKGYDLDLTTGSYSVTGLDQELRAVRELVADLGTYTVSGQTVELNKKRALTLELGSYAVTGQTQELRAVREIVLDAGSYTQTGQTVDIFKGYDLDLTTGSYSVTGQTLDIFKGYDLDLTTGSYTVTGQTVDIFKGYDLDLTTGSYTLTGQSLDLTHVYRLDLDQTPVGTVFRAAGTVASGEGVTSLLPGAPAGQTNGDLLILLQGNQSTSAPSGGLTGWTLMEQKGFWFGANRVRVYAKIADGSNDTPTITFAAAEDCAAEIWAYSGFDKGLGINAYETLQELDQSDLSIPGVWHDADGAEVGIVVHSSQNYNIGPATNSYTQQADIAAPTFASFRKIQSNYGDGNDTVITESGQRFGVIQFRIKPPDSQIGRFGYFGETQTLRAVRELVLTAGSYSVTGYDITLTEQEVAGFEFWLYPPAPRRAKAVDSYVTRRAVYGGFGVGLEPPQTYQLDLVAGSYSVTGQTLDIFKGYDLDLTTGSYTVTGQSLDLTHVYPLELTLGTYSVTGHTQELNAVRELVLDAGSYTQTGYDITLTKVYPLDLVAGSYTLSGQSLDFTKVHPLDLVAGSYTVNGQTLTLEIVRELVLTQGSYAITGYSIDLNKVIANQLDLIAGIYTITGQTLELNAVRELVLTQGSYTLTGQSIDLDKRYTLTLEAGSYAVTGQAHELNAVRELVLDAGSYAQAGQSLDLTRAYPLNLVAGSYTLNGLDGQLLAYRNLTLDLGSYAQTGNDITLQKREGLDLLPGSYAITGYDVELTRRVTLDLLAGAYTLGGFDIDLTKVYPLNLTAGSYTLSGLDTTLTKHALLNLDLGLYNVTGLDLELTPSYFYVPGPPHDTRWRRVAIDDQFYRVKVDDRFDAVPVDDDFERRDL